MFLVPGSVGSLAVFSVAIQVLCGFQGCEPEEVHSVCLWPHRRVSGWWY